MGSADQYTRPETVAAEKSPGCRIGGETLTLDVVVGVGAGEDAALDPLRGTVRGSGISSAQKRTSSLDGSREILESLGDRGRGGGNGGEKEGREHRRRCLRLSSGEKIEGECVSVCKGGCVLGCKVESREEVGKSYTATTQCRHWKRRQDRASGSVCGGCGSGRVRGAQPGLRGKDS